MENFGNSIEDYKVGKLLGRGGYGTVFKAIELRNNFEVAIKMIHKQEIKKLKMEQKVRDEAKIHYTLKHPSILQLYNFFEDDDCVYLVLEYCKFGELDGFLQKHNRTKLSEEEACYIVLQVLDGILYLHRYNIIHRDIKPANLLLDDYKRIKISDFGLATQKVFPAQTHMTMCGTPNYISPEVASEAPHGPPADVWGLGALLYTLLFGRGPFQTTTTKSTLNRIVNEDVFIPENISLECQDLLRKMLRKKQSDRITATAAARHPFFKLYPHATLLCSPSQDSGYDGLCSTCSWWEDTERSQSKNLSKKWIRSKGGGNEISHSTIHTGSHHKSLSYLPSPKAYPEISGSSRAYSKCQDRPIVQNSTTSIPSYLFSLKNAEHNLYCNKSIDCKVNSDHFDESSGFVDGEFSNGLNQQVQKSQHCEPFIFSTKRLRETKCSVGNTVFHLMASGNAVLEEPLEKGRTRYWTVTPNGFMMKHISKSTLAYQQPTDNVEQFRVDHLPSSMQKPYRSLAAFVRKLQSSTVKINLHTKEASCRLMESSPQHFQMTFNTGENVEKDENSVRVTVSGNQNIYCYDTLLEDCDERYFEISKSFIKHFKICLHIERVLSEVPFEINLFPANFGTKETNPKMLQQKNHCNYAIRAQSTPIKSSSERWE